MGEPVDVLIEDADGVGWSRGGWEVIDQMMDTVVMKVIRSIVDVRW